MVSVTTLTSYLYCPRKLFLERVEGYVEIPRGVLVKGAVKHRVFDELTSSEEQLISSLKKSFDWDTTFEQYKSYFSRILRRAVLKSAKQIKMAQLNPMAVFNEFQLFFSKEAETRARYVFDFMQKNKIDGSELWSQLVPKIKSEYKVSSQVLDLSGKIDRVEVYPEQLIPIEIKSGNPPREGAWENHKVQLAAYALLLEDKFGIKVSEGVIHYVDANQKIDVSINPFLREQVKELIKNVKLLFKSRKIPPIAENKNKCAVCGLRKKCHSLVTDEKQNI
ncbi:CRISPR-associated protein Cas4 [Candidatus Woesearchaeota archaeon]|nr:CRISPR-associated protein Cas4 [Candidatus Woesearchaeota archaeon]